MNAPQWFGLRFIDIATGEGIPMIVVETLDRAIHVSDNHGWIALPASTEERWHAVRADGYALPADGFGFRGLRLRAKAGGRRTVPLTRTQVARRISRLTGHEQEIDSRRLGLVSSTNLDAFDGIVGMDSAQTVAHRGKRLWFWGDTTVSGYPLGNFRTSGAVASLPRGAITAANPPRLRVVRASDGRPAPMVPGREPGMVWISGLVECGTGSTARCLAYYSRMRDLGTRLEHGHVEWDESRKCFRIRSRIDDLDSWRHLEGHPIRFTDSGTWIAGGFTFPNTRVRDSVEAILRPDRWEAFTCLDENGKVQRKNGKVVHRWTRAAKPLEPRAELDLIRNGVIKAEDAWYLPVGPDGNVIVPHGGSVAWNPWRSRWIAVFTRLGGSPSKFGEVWYAESPHPIGPWRKAVRVAEHVDHSFYNPVLHPFLDRDGGRIIHFEGTYSEQFADHPKPVPRYEYNQILYALDLSDSRLKRASTEDSDE